MNEGQVTGSLPPLWPLTSPGFCNFASDGKVEFGWDKDGFRITQESMVRKRTLHSSPLTETGWTQIWQTMVSDYPMLATKVASRAGGCKQQLARLTKYAVLPGSTFLGGRKWDDPALVPETPCTLHFTNEGLWAIPSSDDGDRALFRMPYDEMTALEISGPGTVHEGGSLLVGYLAFGFLGAAMASDIKTFIRLERGDAEVFFSCNSMTPEDLRVQLSEPIGKIQPTTSNGPIVSPPEAPPAGIQSARPKPPSVADELRKLGELRDAGLLTVEEFEVQKRGLLE